MPVAKKLDHDWMGMSENIIIMPSGSKDSASAAGSVKTSSSDSSASDNKRKEPVYQAGNGKVL
jgi:hypothetical protein